MFAIIAESGDLFECHICRTQWRYTGDGIANWTVHRQPGRTKCAVCPNQVEIPSNFNQLIKDYEQKREEDQDLAGKLSCDILSFRDSLVNCQAQLQLAQETITRSQAEKDELIERLAHLEDDIAAIRTAKEKVEKAADSTLASAHQQLTELVQEGIELRTQKECSDNAAKELSERIAKLEKYRNRVGTAEVDLEVITRRAQEAEQKLESYKKSFEGFMIELNHFPK